MMKKQKKRGKASKKVRRGDKVFVTTGNFKGETGTVLRIEDDRIVVQGVNVRKKHMKATQQNPNGEIMSIEKPIHVSNVKVCGEDGKPVKLKVKTNENNERSLVYSANGSEQEYRSVKKSER